jgi:hypothetical protein
MKLFEFINKYRFLFAIAMIIYTIYDLCLAQTGSGILTALVVGGMHDNTNELYRVGIATRKMQLLAEKKSTWLQFMGFIGGKRDMFKKAADYSQLDSPKATGMPIEVLQDFRTKKGAEMEVPVFSGLTELGVSGGVRAKGTGEKAKLSVIKCHINQKRKVFELKDTFMSEQIWDTEEIRRQLYDKAPDYLGDWFGSYLSLQPDYALLEGFSENLTNPDGGTSPTKQSHMNFYVEGTGRVAFSNVIATYEAAIAAALTGIKDTAVFNMDTLSKMAFHASQDHLIEPIQFGGQFGWLVRITAAQAWQLQQDPKYIERAIHAVERSIKNNPAVTGNLIGYINNCFVFVDSTIPSAYVNGDAAISTARQTYVNDKSTTGDANGVSYGTADANGKPDFMLNRIDPGTRQIATLLGKSAVMCGIARDIEFMNENDDFGDKEEVAARWVGGFQRSDIYDMNGVYGTTGDKRYRNNSSLIFVTNTPSSPTYA